MRETRTQKKNTLKKKEREKEKKKRGFRVKPLKEKRRGGRMTGELTNTNSESALTWAAPV